jgi:hypothetical protein
MRPFVLAVLLLALAPATASAGFLSKTEARAEGLKFVTPIGDLLEIGVTNRVRMVPPRECRRISRVTVTCGFTVEIVSEPRVVRGSLRIRRQRDGLLGFLLPWNPEDVWVPTQPVTVG